MDPRRFFNAIPGVGGTLTALWGDPGQEAHQEAMAKAQEMMKMYRSQSMDSRMNAMTQGASAFAPRNQMLGQMMGQQGPLMDLAPMMQNPMSPAMQNDIRAQAFGAPPPSSAPPGFGGGAAGAGGAFTGVGPQNPYRRA